MCIFNRKLINSYRINMTSKPMLTIWIGFLIGLIIQMVWVRATHMDNLCHIMRYAVETALQPLNTKIQGVLNLTCKEKFIDLNLATTRINKR